jgi:hypothetical protein
LHEQDDQEANAAALEITNLDPQKESSPACKRWLDGQRLSVRARLWLALFTLGGVALFSWLVLSQVHVTGASPLEKGSTEALITSLPEVRPRYVQIVVVHQVIYLLDQDGLLKAMWRRQKYTYLLWQQRVAPSSQLVRVDQDVVYLATPGGRTVALRASDGALVCKTKGALSCPLAVDGACQTCGS